MEHGREFFPKCNAKIIEMSTTRHEHHMKHHDFNLERYAIISWVHQCFESIRIAFQQSIVPIIYYWRITSLHRGLFWSTVEWVLCKRKVRSKLANVFLCEIRWRWGRKHIAVLPQNFSFEFKTDLTEMTWKSKTCSTGMATMFLSSYKQTTGRSQEVQSNDLHFLVFSFFLF